MYCNLNYKLLFQAQFNWMVGILCKINCVEWLELQQIGFAPRNSVDGVGRNCWKNDNLNSFVNLNFNNLETA